MNRDQAASTAKASGVTPIGTSLWEEPVAIRKVTQVAFQGPAPENADLAQLYQVLPSINSPMYIDPADSVVRTALNKIRDDCQVWIEFQDDGSILISGETVDNLGNALFELRRFQRGQAKALEGTATILVHRVDGANTVIVLEPSDNVGGTACSIADGQMRGVAQAGVTTAQASDVEHRLLPRLIFDAIQQSASFAGPSLGRKYARIHLGPRTMSKKKKEETMGLEGTYSKKATSTPFNPDALEGMYATEQYQALLNSAVKRGHSSFYLCFGGENLTQAILEHIYSTYNENDHHNNKFVALDATVDRLEDIKPEFTLVFFSKGLRIEMDINFETVRTKTAPIAITKGSRSQPAFENKPTASPPRVFRFNKMVDAEVIVACPDMKVDWQISIESDLSAEKIHDRFRKLATELRFEAVPEGTLTFPNFTVSSQALQAASISSVACKVYSTFECVQSPFLVQVAAYYDWHKHLLFDPNTFPVDPLRFDTSGSPVCPAPNKSCAVSLFGLDWDDKMKDLNPDSKTFASDLVDVFNQDIYIPAANNLAPGVDSTGKLVREVEYLLDVTTQAATELASMENGTQGNLTGEDGMQVPDEAPTEAFSALVLARGPDEDQTNQLGIVSAPLFDYSRDSQSQFGPESLLDFDAQPEARPEAYTEVEQAEVTQAPAEQVQVGQTQVGQAQADKEDVDQDEVEEDEECLMDFSDDSLLDFAAQPDAK